MAADIAARIRPGTPTVAVATALTSSPEAYDSYLKGLIARNATAGRWYDSADTLYEVEELFSAAIAQDVDFAAAYAERAALGMAMFVRNIDASTSRVDQARDDVDTATRLAPSTAKTQAARAWQLFFIEADHTGATAAFAAAQTSGLADPMWMLDTAMALSRIGRQDEALRLIEHALTVDPANAVSIAYYASMLASLRRPRDAVRILENAYRELPGEEPFAALQAFITFAHMGRDDVLTATTNPNERGHGLFMAGEMNHRLYQQLRWQGHLDELWHALRDSPAITIRAALPGVGLEPVARHEGWISLLRQDRAAAADAAERIRDFLAASEETEHNRFFRRLLAAEAHTFAAEPAQAVNAAREALAFATRRCCLEDALHMTVAAVYAWNGAADEAAGA